MAKLTPAEMKKQYSAAMAAMKAGRGAEALGLFTQLVQIRPDLPEAHFQIGRLYASSGDMTKAEAAFRKALILRPKESGIWQALGQIVSGPARDALAREAKRAGVNLVLEPNIQPLMKLIAAGRSAEAEPQALALVRQFPNAAGPALALGASRLAQRKWSLALGPLEKAVERAPSDPRANMILGEAHLGIKQYNQAETFLMQAGKLGAPVNVPMARLYQETCRFEEASEVLARAKAAQPKDQKILLEQSKVFAVLQRPKDSIAAAKAAVSAGAPKTALATCAERLGSEGQLQAAADFLAGEIENAPDDADLLTIQGQLLQSKGDIEAAHAILKRAFDADGVGDEAIRAYVAGQKIAADDPIFDEMEERLGRPDLSRHAFINLSYAMGKALEDAGRFEDVFQHLNAANEYLLKEFPYEVENELPFVRSIIRAEEVNRSAELDHGTAADAPIFVTGLPRSGTTLVETILSAHSQVEAGGELPFISSALAQAIEGSAASGVSQPAAFAEAGHRYLAAARRRLGTDGRFTDKAISTFSRVGPTLRALPNAKVVILRRDPRDVGYSIYKNRFPAGSHLYATDLKNIGQYIKLHDALVAQWIGLYPDRIHVVDYDALTADPEQSIRDLIAAVGLEWEDGCLAPHMTKRKVETLSFAQVRQPIYRGSVGAWQRYETELEPLLEALQQPVSY